MRVSHNDIDDLCQVGQEITYIIELLNDGGVDITGLLVHNTIPEETQFVEAKSPGKYKVVGREVRFLPVEIKRQQRLTYKIICKAIKAGTAINIVKFRNDQRKEWLTSQEGTSIEKK